VNTWAIVPAAGSGRRLGGGRPKAMRDVAGRPMVAHVVLALLEARSISGIVVVGPHEVYHAVEAWAPEILGVEGGETRQASVRAGLDALPATAQRVVVHDAARPLVTSDLIERVATATRRADAVVAAVPLQDTLKRAFGDAVDETIPRDDLWRAQTPQGFRTYVLRAAHERAERDRFEGTDDAQLVERIGVKPEIVRGDEINFKVTTVQDLDLAELILRSRWRVW
jgi:2-C-methyl-D-erythritol 4-phosphate cytidylyltransferase